MNEQIFKQGQIIITYLGNLCIIAVINPFDAECNEYTYDLDGGYGLRLRNVRQSILYKILSDEELLS